MRQKELTATPLFLEEKTLAWKINPEGRALSYLAFHLYVAPGVFYHFLDHIQANARAFYMGMETFKHGEKLNQAPLFHAKAIILYT